MQAGTPLIQPLCLTGNLPAVCINPLTLQEHNGNIGLPISSTELSVRDDEDRELGIGVDQVGEILVSVARR